MRLKYYIVNLYRQKMQMWIVLYHRIWKSFLEEFSPTAGIYMLTLLRTTSRSGLKGVISFFLKIAPDLSQKGSLDFHTTVSRNFI